MDTSVKKREDGDPLINLSDDAVGRNRAKPAGFLTGPRNKKSAARDVSDEAKQNHGADLPSKDGNGKLRVVSEPKDQGSAHSRRSVVFGRHH